MTCHDSNTILPFAVSEHIATLQALSALRVVMSLPGESPDGWIAGSDTPPIVKTLISGLQQNKLETTALGCTVKEVKRLLLTRSGWVGVIHLPIPRSTRAHCRLVPNVKYGNGTTTLSHMMYLEHFGCLLPLLRASKKKGSSHTDTFVVQLPDSSTVLGVVKLGAFALCSVTTCTNSLAPQDIGHVEVKRRDHLKPRVVMATFDDFTLHSRHPLDGDTGYYMVDDTGRVTAGSSRNTAMELGGREVRNVYSVFVCVCVYVCIHCISPTLKKQIVHKSSYITAYIVHNAGKLFSLSHKERHTVKQ